MPAPSAASDEHAGLGRSLDWRRASDTRRHSSRQATHLVLECLLEAMPNNKGSQGRIELLQGTLDMLILRTLQWGPQHGHGVGQAIRQSSVDLLLIERGSLYPALHRLEARGLIASEWKASDLNRRAKYYRLTAAGREPLVAEQSQWKPPVKAIPRGWRPGRGGRHKRGAAVPGDLWRRKRLQS